MENIDGGVDSQLEWSKEMYRFVEARSDEEIHPLIEGTKLYRKTMYTIVNMVRRDFQN